MSCAVVFVRYLLATAFIGVGNIRYVALMYNFAGVALGQPGYAGRTVCSLDRRAEKACPLRADRGLMND